jgi:hypothetical protein
MLDGNHNFKSSSEAIRHYGSLTELRTMRYPGLNPFVSWLLLGLLDRLGEQPLDPLRVWSVVAIPMVLPSRSELSK